MDGDALLQKSLDMVKKIPRSAYLPLGMGLIGLVFLCIGLIELVKPYTASQDLPLPSTLTTPSVPQVIQVDVEGAVQNPGVYHVPSTGRLQDALIAAGGLSADADRAYVEKNINLASKLIDGGKVYIPFTGSQIPEVGNQTQNSGVLGGVTALLDINSATTDQLDSLPGIGQVTAQKIIQGRPYSSVDELLTKKVVNQKVYGEIKDKVIVN